MKDHLDAAWAAHKAGDNEKADDHLVAARDAAIYGGTAPALKQTIRQTRIALNPERT